MADPRTRTTSVMYPMQPNRLDEVVPFARLVQRRGAGRFWLGQSVAVDSQQIFAALVGAGIVVPFGTAVVLTPLRHPYDAAISARSVARLSGLPYVAGIGPGAPEFQATIRAAPYPRPATVSASYLATMRTLLAGGRAENTENDAEHYTRASLPVIETPEVELGLGVLRPGMARAAGRVADVAITWLTPPAYLRDRIVPALRESAAEAGRATPRVATVVHVAVDRADRDVVELAHTATQFHLSANHYCDMLRQAGLPADPADPRSGAELLVKSGTFVSGSPSDIAAGLAEYWDSGVDEVILNLAGVSETYGPGAAITDLVDICAEIDGGDHDD